MGERRHLPVRVTDGEKVQGEDTGEKMRARTFGVNIEARVRHWSSRHGGGGSVTSFPCYNNTGGSLAPNQRCHETHIDFERKCSSARFGWNMDLWPSGTDMHIPHTALQRDSSVPSFVLHNDAALQQ